jgi:acetyl esterase
MASAGILHPTTVEGIQKAYRFYATLQGAPEPVFRVADRQIPGPAGDLKIRIYSPKAEANLPIFVFFHGGGFVAGSIESHDVPLRAIANRCTCILVSVAYRLAPTDPYPAAPEDAYAATAWVAKHASEIGGDPRRVAVGGDGTGGNLAAVVTLMSRDRGGPNLNYQVLIYPMTDATIMKAAWWAESPEPLVTHESRIAVLSLYVPSTKSLHDPYLSPIYAEGFKNLPPALILTDEDDPTRDEAEQYANRLTEAGVPTTVFRYPNMIHGFFLMAGQLDAGKKSIDQVAAALKQTFSVERH